MCHSLAQDASKLEHRAARPSRFAGAFLGVFRNVLVQLRFDDIRCFCGFERLSHLNAAPASPEARTPRPYGKAAARASARGRHACGIADRWQRDHSRGITSSISYSEQLWPGAAVAGGASSAVRYIFAGTRCRRACGISGHFPN